MKTTPLTRVIAALLAAPLAMTPALAGQHTSAEGQSAEQSQEAQSGDSQSSTGAQSADGQSASGAQSGDEAQGDRLIATVDGTEITAADVQAAINALPQQMRQRMPSEMLASMAVDQLVLRQLILQEAEAQNLSEDPEVQQLIEQNQRANEEDAMLQVYVQRQLEGAVTDEKVQQTYDEIAAQSEEEVPPLEDVRPQVEQQLRQQRLAEVRDELMQDVEIVYYGPDGEPMEASTDPAGATGQSGSGSDGSGSATDGSGSGSATDGSAESGSAGAESGSESGSSGN